MTVDAVPRGAAGSLAVPDGVAGSLAVPGGVAGSLAGLRRLAESREPAERCDLCSAPLAPHPHHEHLLEPAARTVACACTPCALLFPPDARRRYLRVPRRLWYLRDCRLDDELWESLAIPVNIAFLHTSAPSGDVHAHYPSPAGATESLLTLDAWRDVVVANPVLAGLEPEVEALLINRLGDRREHYLVPIDRCFELVGLVRLSWRGLSGGTEAWQRIGGFFDDLRAHARERGNEGA